MGFRDDIYKEREAKKKTSSFREQIITAQKAKKTEPPKTVTLTFGKEKVEVPQPVVAAMTQEIRNRQPFVLMENNLRAKKAAEKAQNKAVENFKNKLVEADVPAMKALLEDTTSKRRFGPPSKLEEQLTELIPLAEGLQAERRNQYWRYEATAQDLPKLGLNQDKPWASNANSKLYTANHMSLGDDKYKPTTNLAFDYAKKRIEELTPILEAYEGDSMETNEVYLDWADIYEETGEAVTDENFLKEVIAKRDDYRAKYDEYNNLTALLEQLDYKGVHFDDNGNVDTESGRSEAEILAKAYNTITMTNPEFAGDRQTDALEGLAGYLPEEKQKLFDEGLQMSRLADVEAYKVGAYDEYDKRANSVYNNDFFGRVGGNARMTMIGKQSNDAGYASMIAGVDDIEASDVYSLLQNQIIERNKATFTNNNQWDETVASVAAYAPQWLDQTVERAKGWIAGQALSMGSGVSLGSAMQSAFAAHYMYKQTAGAAYVRHLRNNISVEDATKLAKDEALTSSIIEFGLDYTLSGAAKSVKATGFGKGASDVLKQTESGLVKRMVGLGISESTAKKIISGSKVVAGNVIDAAGEGLEEWLQEGVSVTADRYAAQGKDSSVLGLLSDSLNFSQYSDEELASMNQSFAGGFIVGLVSDSLGSVGNSLKGKVFKNTNTEQRKELQNIVNAISTEALGEAILENSENEIANPLVKQLITSGMQSENPEIIAAANAVSNAIDGGQIPRADDLGTLMKDLFAGDESEVTSTAEKSSDTETAPATEDEAPMEADDGIVHSGEKVNVTPGFTKNEYSYDVSNKTIRALDAIGKKLGVEIEIGAPTGNSYEAYNGKYENGKITIARDAENPLEVVLSHEVTHHMQKVAPAEYAKFVELAVNASTKLSDMDKSALIKRYREEYSAGTKTKFSDQAAIDEITADYASKLVRDVSLFRGLLNADRNVAQRFVDSVKRFISSVKSTFSKDKKEADTASLEKYGLTVSELEKAINAYEGMIKNTREAVESGLVGADMTSSDAEIFGSADRETENTVGTDADGVKYDLKKDARRNVDKAVSQKGYNGEIELTTGSPSIITSQKGTKNYPLVMKASHIRENILTEKEAKTMGLKVNKNIHYHGLGKEKFLNIIEDLDNVTEAYRGTRNADKPERRENYFLLISKYTDEAGNVINVPIYIDEKAQVNNVFIDVNKVATVFGREGLRLHIKEQIAKGNLVRIKNRSINASEGSSLINDHYSKDASTDSIPETTEKSNPQFSLKKNTDNQGRELSVEQTEYFADSKVRDNEGNLRVMYRGGNEDFTVFDRKKSKYSNLYGRGFYFTDSESHAGQYGKVREYYLNIKNPVSTTEKTITREQVRAFLEAVAGNEDDYSFENYGYGVTVDSVLDSVYGGKSDFSIIYDVSQTAIGDMVEAVELFNEINGTTFDGLILDTETVTFNSNQAKSVNNKTPTGNPDINMSLKRGDMLSKDYKPRVGAGDGTEPSPAVESSVRAEAPVVEDVPKGADVVVSKMESAADVPEEKAPMESGSYLEETGIVEAEVPPEMPAVTKEKKAPAPKKVKKAPKESGSYLEDSGFLDYYNEQERTAQGYSGSYFDETGLGDQFFTTDQRVQQERAKVQKEKEHTRERVSKIYSEQRKRELRGQILRATKKLDQTLRNPTDKKHIPKDLQKPVANLLRAINLEGMGLEYGTDAMYHRVDPTENPFAEPTKRTMAFLELKRAYEKIGGEDSTITISPELLEGDAEGNGKLFDKIIEMKDIPMYRMDEQQLRIVKNAISAVTNSVVTANKLFSSSRMKTISDVADAVRAGAKMKNKRIEIGGLSKLKKLVTLDMMTPETYFHHLGDGGDAIFRMLRDAQDKKTLLTERAMNFASELVKDVKISELEKPRHDVVLGGEEMKLSTAQLMELYLLSKRAQAEAHIFRGGIIPETGPGIKKVVQSSVTRGIKPQEVGRALDLLSPEEKKMADKMSEFATSVLGAEMNEACLKVFGYEKFGERNYWPIRTADSAIKSDEKQAGGKKAPPSIRNFGMANATRPKAKTPLKLGSVFETFASHSAEATTYAAYLEATEDLRRIINFKFFDEKLDEKDTMKEVVEKTFGEGGVQYWSKLDEDIAGGMSGDDSGFLSTVLGRTKAAAVAANLRVVLQQPTALLRAGDMIDYKYIAKGVAHPKRGWERAVKYSPIAKWKSFGFFDSNSGPRTKDLIFDQSGKLEKIREWGMKGAEIADAFGWGSLWSACEAELRAKIKKGGLKLTPGSREFYEKVRRRFDEIIDHTQVVDGVLQRSQIMRSSNAIDKLATAFRAEPTKTVNMLMSAVSDLTTAKSTASRKVAAKRLARTAMSLLISSTITAALGQSIMDAIRDDDKEKDYWERWLEHFGGNMKAAVNPLQYYPYIGDVMSMAEGYSVGRYDMQLIEKVIKTARNIAEAFSDENKKSPLGAINDAFAVFGELFGVGTGNIKRDVSAIVSEIAHGTNNLQLEYFLAKETYEIQNEKNSKTFYDILRKAYETDKQAYEAIRADMIKNGYDEEEIEKKMKKPTTAGSLDQAVTEARKAKSSKDATPADKVVYKHLNREKNAERGAGAATQEEVVNNLPTYRESVEKYLDEYPGADEEKAIDYAYRKANYATYGAKYAIRASGGKSIYDKALEKVNRGKTTWEEYYDEYFGKDERRYEALRDRFDISYEEYEKIAEAMSKNSTEEEEIEALHKLGYRRSTARVIRRKFNKVK